jgi:hypothetical protein
MKFANATNLDRKSGVAQWRDLLFLFQFSHRLGRAGKRMAKIVKRWRRGTTYIHSGAAPRALGRCCGIDIPPSPGFPVELGAFGKQGSQPTVS